LFGTSQRKSTKELWSSRYEFPHKAIPWVALKAGGWLSSQNIFYAHDHGIYPGSTAILSL
jgi:hypothetical protein